MLRPPPRPTRHDTLLPDPTLSRSQRRRRRGGDLARRGNGLSLAYATALPQRQRLAGPARRTLRLVSRRPGHGHDAIRQQAGSQRQDAVVRTESHGLADADGHAAAGPLSAADRSRLALPGRPRSDEHTSEL